MQYFVSLVRYHISIESLWHSRKTQFLNKSTQINDHRTNSTILIGWNLAWECRKSKIFIDNYCTVIDVDELEFFFDILKPFLTIQKPNHSFVMFFKVESIALCKINAWNFVFHQNIYESFETFLKIVFLINIILHQNFEKTIDTF